MNREEYEKLKIIKTVEGNEIVEKYYNPITCTMVSKADIDCYKYKQALLDIKEYIEKEKNSNLVKEEYETPGYLKHDILEIVNEALGDKENE